MTTTPQPITDPNRDYPGWTSSTAGRSGRSYADFLAQHPDFDPYTNLDTYVGAGGSQSSAAQQAFGWLNEWARNNGFGDGARIPIAQRQQMYLAFLERARQGEADRGENWNLDAASKIPNQGWDYQAGWGLSHGGQSYERLGATGGSGAKPNPVTAAPSTGNAARPTPATPAPGLAATTATTATTAPSTPQTGGNPVADQTGGAKPNYGPNSAAVLAQDPDAAYRASLQMQGHTYAPRGLFTAFRQSRMGNALAAMINAATNGGTKTLDDVNSLIGQFNTSANSGHFYKDMQNFGANSLAGMDLSQMDPKVVDQLMKQILGLETMGLGPAAQNARGNQYEDLLTGITDRSLLNDAEDQSNYGSLIQSSDFFKRLAALR